MNIITYYVTSENIRYHNTEFTSDFKSIDKLVSTNYYQEYNGEHIE
jgi:hypothetical protein